MFAILGLRSLYTVLSSAVQDLKYLQPAVALILGFVGAKLIAEYFGMDVGTGESLGVILSLLGGGIGETTHQHPHQYIELCAPIIFPPTKIKKKKPGR
mmetsp:Transcript_7098/g.13966  ORF Transcript_7098/g.13966 Transcript_7098/m.13966 type:complete len:98 (+) Transcript_7098:3-296(+)